MTRDAKQFTVGLIGALILACGGISKTLNPDPVHGGDCHDGNQLGVLCSSVYFPAQVWCCPTEYSCGNGRGECIPPDPPVFGLKGDSGTDSGILKDSGL